MKKNFKKKTTALNSPITKNLYPLLTMNGILIIDDYGHWERCRKAVDEYFAPNYLTLLLNRIDNTARIAVKTS